MDNDWLDRAKQINQLRNKAAHSYSQSDIYKHIDEILMIDGEDSFEKSKSYFLDTIKVLLKVNVTECNQQH